MECGHTNRPTIWSSSSSGTSRQSPSTASHSPKSVSLYTAICSTGPWESAVAGEEEVEEDEIMAAEVTTTTVEGAVAGASATSTVRD